MESTLEQLKRLLRDGQAFDFNNFSHQKDPTYAGPDRPEWLAWKTRAKNTIYGALSEESAPMVMLARANNIPTQGYGPEDFNHQKALMLSAVQHAIRILEEDVFGEKKAPKSKSSSGALSNRVFVVHGHDHATKTELEVFLSGLGLEPVVLHRQPDQGKTVIEKFEHHSDVGFAFILLTPDDISYSALESKMPDEERKKEFRARPNVIFEFGYFVGKLGRAGVCCLVKGDVTRPSDIEGLVYKPVKDSIEAIGFELIRELQAAGYTINLKVRSK